ncbi:ATP-binding protein [Acinetobacter ihumii]|uniref:ATP-binding protein n=1 Tax=Acinetobacter ihumii TaxID=2483802 RepID=UPI0010318B34|nr:ATP-binding protein [Acinetobacter ihumii]
MSHPTSTSLQSKLLRTTLWSGVIAAAIAFVLLVFLSCYHNMTVQDEIMDEVSDMLLLSDQHLPSGQQLDELSDEFDLQYALYWNNQLLTHSKAFDTVLFEQYVQPEFSLLWRQGKLWRVYEQSKTEAHLKTIVVQPLSARFDEIWQSLIWYLIVLIVLWCLQCGLVRWGIRRDLAVLRQLSHSITSKSPQDLQPISKQKMLLEIEPVIDSLNQLLQRLNRALQAEQSFTADASHELRSPLSAIQMRLQLIQRKYRDLPELSQDLSQIQTDVKRSTLVLENLLLLARLDPTHEQELTKSRLALDEVVIEVIDSLSLFAHSKHIAVLQSFNATNTHIFANRELIFSCIRNLLDNAIRYSPEFGQVQIQLDNLKYNHQHYIQLSIMDSGDGVDDEVLQRLGQRFFRGLGTGQQGSGLGLSITKKIIDLHQAELNFSRSKQGGLNAEIRFELAESFSI